MTLKKLLVSLVVGLTLICGATDSAYAKKGGGKKGRKFRIGINAGGTYTSFDNFPSIGSGIVNALSYPVAGLHATWGWKVVRFHGYAEYQRFAWSAGTTDYTRQWITGLLLPSIHLGPVYVGAGAGGAYDLGTLPGGFEGLSALAAYALGVEFGRLMIEGRVQFDLAHPKPLSARYFLAQIGFRFL